MSGTTVGERGALGGPAAPARVKLCGLSRPADVMAANEARPDYAGFVVEVPTSSRNVSAQTLRELTPLLAEGIRAVGVFVDAPLDLVAELLADGVIDVAQLHGHEDDAYVRELCERARSLGEGSAPAGPDAFRVMQAFRIRTANDVARAQASPAPMVLLDSGAGSGETFDWSLARTCARPYFLAGGLSPENLAQAVEQVRPFGVDMSSGIETNGVKDAAKMRAAVAAVRGAAQ